MQEKEAIKVSKVSIIANIVLSLFKLIAGIVANSYAMISDAIHSASDVVSSVIVIIGVKIANKASDKSHPYGHERFECIASIILSVILIITGLGIGVSGIRNIFTGEYQNLEMPGLIALIMAIVSIVTKEAMYWYTRGVAKKINSSAVMADAWHHRSDALSSIGSFIGILGARMGFLVLDSVASIVITIFIVKAGVDIFIETVKELTDEACDEDTVNKIYELIEKENGVMRIDDVKTRKFGNRIYVDIEISADGEKTLTETHKIAENVHDSIEENMVLVKHCMVHVNPYE
ncbi:MAG: cation transporter [Clostridia bacterium]|nr:cation transporter [Clostridia bacterium]MCI9275937.1 cation transporter [Clostridia bacterium]